MANSKTTLNESYPRMYLMLAILHIAYVQLFIFGHCEILVAYNAVASLFYIGLALAARRAKRMAPIFYTCWAEIITNSVLSTLLTGLSTGFLLHLLSTMMVSFYLNYRFNKANFRIALTSCSLNLVLIVASGLAWLFGHTQMYALDESITLAFFLLNCGVTAVVITAFSLYTVTHISENTVHLERINQSLVESANKDALTQLLNRRPFEEHIENFHMVADWGSPYCVLMCDLDHFKEVNDDFGHECGDEVLRHVAGAIKASLRPTDLAFRWGGEEILILAKASSEEAHIIAERCRKTIEEMDICFEDAFVKITLTIGIGAYEPGLTAEQIVNKADENLYLGKKSGRNCVVG